MFSEHLLLLAAVSAKENAAMNILEIGTFDGRTSLILGKLFPKSKILTIDLPHTDTEFTNSYNRNASVAAFLETRKSNLEQATNVTFEAMNSLGLSKSEGSFDLIWIDGAHGYPVVAMDVVNSYRLAKPGGYVLIDDIWTKTAKSDSMYNSVGGFESLTALSEARLIESFTLFPKRLGGLFNYPGQQKFVGLFRKH